MKKLFLISFFLVFLIFGCSNDKKNENEVQKKTNSSEKTVKTKSYKAAKAKEKKALETKILLSAVNYDGEIEGEAIILNENETKPLKMEGSKVMALKMPDGNLWQVKKSGDKNMLVMPDGKLVEEKMINGKMILIEDDSLYEVKMINDKMIAVKNNSAEIKVALE